MPKSETGEGRRVPAAERLMPDDRCEMTEQHDQPVHSLPTEPDGRPHQLSSVFYYLIICHLASVICHPAHILPRSRLETEAHAQAKAPVGSRWVERARRGRSAIKTRLAAAQEAEQAAPARRGRVRRAETAAVAKGEGLPACLVVVH